uniref:Uncharacterized protein n=1 Tax=Oryza sativa subsp. japonica TaxID=39947 RepID=Q6EQL0_ORYSJ|nr:hypothetical protein [Oryza sativa Japonica Group]
MIGICRLIGTAVCDLVQSDRAVYAGQTGGDRVVRPWMTVIERSDRPAHGDLMPRDSIAGDGSRVDLVRSNRRHTSGQTGGHTAVRPATVTTGSRGDSRAVGPINLHRSDQRHRRDQTDRSTSVKPTYIEIEARRRRCRPFIVHVGGGGVVGRSSCTSSRRRRRAGGTSSWSSSSLCMSSLGSLDDDIVIACDVKAAAARGGRRAGGPRLDPVAAAVPRLDLATAAVPRSDLAAVAADTTVAVAANATMAVATDATVAVDGGLDGDDGHGLSGGRGLPCGWYNLTARDNRLFHAVGPPAHENIDFSRPLVPDGENLHTEKSI